MAQNEIRAKPRMTNKPQNIHCWRGSSRYYFQVIIFNFKWFLLIRSSKYRRCHHKKQRAHAAKRVLPQSSHMLHVIFLLLSMYFWPKGTPLRCIQVDPEKTSKAITSLILNASRVIAHCVERLHETEGMENKTPVTEWAIYCSSRCQGCH